MKRGLGWVVLVGLALVLFAVLRHNRELQDRTRVRAPESFDFQCTACNHGWTMAPSECAEWFPGGMHSANHAVKCVDCGKTAAFIETRCPWCEKGYVPEYIVRDPQGYPTEDPCPHCGKDTLKWKR